LTEELLNRRRAGEHVGEAVPNLVVPLDEILDLIDRVDDPAIQDAQALHERMIVLRQRVAGLARTVGDLSALSESLAGQRTYVANREVMAGNSEVSTQLQVLEEQRQLAEAQAIRAIQDLRGLRVTNREGQTARALAEAQQLRAISDFKTEHRRAVLLAAELRAAYLHTITALARAVEARDQYTGGHVERVRFYSVQIGRQLGMPDDELMYLEFGAVLHDVGKIGVPDMILHKPGPLDQEDWLAMRRHPEIGMGVLKDVGFLTIALDVVACHHEQWDGGGYPRGLAGDQIPIGGRIVSVADTFDAMTSDRPYRRGLPIEVALAELDKYKGSRYDPQVVEAFLSNPPALPPAALTEL
jgi:HD-GYP domain-containing protein (c-di-GMP phosphodiesterase class II)